MYRFRDPIHGFIEVSPLERAIIDTEPFQRLRRIKQLATANLVYHGAEHTRFGHSLGVMHLVSSVFDSVMAKNQDLFSEKQTAWYRQILRIIGLTHDLGHGPFSHASEHLFEDGLQHEDYTKEILLATEVGDCIRDVGSEFQIQYGSEYPITPELIWMIYSGDISQADYVYPDFQFLKSFMDGELDCDKMDYLLRDSYYCGVKYGMYDMERLVDSFTVYSNPDESILMLAIERGGVHALEEFVLARYFMFLQVYFHKSRRLLDKHLLDCLGRVLPGGKYPIDINEYLKWDDVHVLSEASRQRDVLEVGRFLSREMMPCVYSTKTHLQADGDRCFRMTRGAIEKGMEAAGIDVGQNLWCDDMEKAVHGISGGALDDRSIPVMVEYQTNPVSVLDESLLLGSLDRAIQIKRIYVSKGCEDLARGIIKELNR